MILATFALDYLLNALWTAPLLFAAAWSLSRPTSRLGPSVEHRLWLACLALQLTLPACRIAPRDLMALARYLWPWHGASAADTTGVSIALGPAHALPHLVLAHGLASLLLTVYLCVIGFGVMRLLLGLRNTQWLRRSAVPQPHNKTLCVLWQAACARFSITAVPLLESSAVTGPITIGLRSQAVLLPVGWVNHIAAHDLEAALTHECAHLRRHDYGKNLFYRTLVLPLFWHPAVRATLASIATTREMLCDDLAISALPGQAGYAQSLLRLAALMATAPPPASSHAIGALDANSFERRVMRLATTPLHASRGLRMAIVALSLTVAAATCASALALRLEIVPAAGQSESPRRISPGVMAGNATYQKRPVYPPEAKEKHITGAVVLHAIITKQGNVDKLEVVSGPDDLRASALDAVKDWRYKPYLLNGQPTAVETTITVNYQLQK